MESAKAIDDSTQEPDDPLAIFVAACLRSGLVSRKQLARAADATGDASGHSAERISDELVRHEIVTDYQAEQLRAGRAKMTLGPYLITDFIGQGGMGRVFKATHRVMNRPCAVKVLPLEKSNENSRQSFMREIQLQAELDSPFVVRAFDAGHDGNVHYLVTEYVPGTDLRRLVRMRAKENSPSSIDEGSNDQISAPSDRGAAQSQGPLSMIEAASIISQTAKGLAYAHSLGLLHRDIKPGNILVSPEGHAKLSDIGLAAWSMDLDTGPRAGKIVGTADYLSPEHIRDPKSIGMASDIYSLGCTLYYAVTGRVPFPGGDTKDKCRRHLHETPWHPRNLAADLTEDFVEIVADMMNKDPAARISEAEIVVRRLEPWASAAGAAGLDLTAADMAGMQSLPTRSAWLPPPPPREPDAVPNAAPDAQGAGDTWGGDNSQTSHAIPGTENAIAAPPASLQPHVMRRRRKPRRMSTGLVIALTLSIAVPLSLLVGAISGFLLRDRM
ncbi:MAG: serine/threonine-protein kinase [Planctomycetota bacterium]